MKLGEMLDACDYRLMNDDGRSLEREIRGVAYDSRKVVHDGLFVAIRGETSNGHDFIADSVGKGAAAVVVEQAEGLCEKGVMKEAPEELRAATSVIQVPDSRKALACISHNFYGRPSEELSVIGVTGTNGKTTTTYLIRSMLEAMQSATGLIGTINYVIGNRRYPSVHTTPESLEFQGLLREMVSAGCSSVVAEVSSHSLSQRRVDFTRFVVVVFTNLTRDHLDYHGTMEEYYRAKKRLFSELLTEKGSAVINTDDPWGQRLVDELSQETGAGGPTEGWRRRRNLLSYGLRPGADIRAADLRLSRSGLSFNLKHGETECRIDSPLLGIPNTYNVLAAASVGLALQIPLDVIREGIGRVEAIEGRLEKVDAGQDFLCIVDYAHTPDALERLILTAREILGTGGRTVKGKQGGKIVTVFGCGGDRDRGKRPIMGEIATRLSDTVVLTSDNPRSEDPLAIIDEIRSGISAGSYVVIPDRREAVRHAIGLALSGDIVIIAGKGHEDYQEIQGVRHPFSDKTIAAEEIKARTRSVRDT